MEKRAFFAILKISIFKTFFRRCGYCDIPYKVIGKAETFGEDVKFIGRLAKADFKPIGTIFEDLS